MTYYKNRHGNYHVLDNTSYIYSNRSTTVKKVETLKNIGDIVAYTIFTMLTIFVLLSV